MRRLIASFVAVLAFSMLGLPAYAFTVKVVTSENKPVAKAKVIISTHDGKEWKHQTIFTNKEGVFNYDPPSSSKYWYRYTIIASGYTCYSDYHNANNKDKPPVILHKEKKLKGKVVDENGKPLKGAKVTLKSFQAFTPDSLVTFQNNFESEFTTITKADGSFTLDHTPNPDIFDDIFDDIFIEIDVTLDGYALVPKHIHNLQEDLVITCPLESKLEGTVYLPDNEGIAPAGISLTARIIDNKGEFIDNRYTVVKENGKYCFDKLPPGKACITMKTSIPGGTSKKSNIPEDLVLKAVEDIKLVSNETQNIDLTLMHGVLFKCKIVDKNTKTPFKIADANVIHGGSPNGIPTLSLSQLDFENRKSECAAYVVPGEVTISVLSAGNDEQSRHDFYDFGIQPKMTSTVTAGKDNEVVFEIDPAEFESIRSGFTDNPVIEDLELTPGTYNLIWNPNIISSNPGFRNVYDGSRIKKLPELKTDNPMYFGLGLDGTDNDGYLYVVLDESNGTGTGYNTAYIDVNRNRDLSDDTPVTFVPSRMVFTEWTTIQSYQGPAGSDRTNNPVQVRLEIDFFDNSPYVTLQKRCMDRYDRYQ